MRRHFVSGFPRALFSLSQEKSSGVEIVLNLDLSASLPWVRKPFDLEPFNNMTIGHVRYINIHTRLRGFIVKFEYCFVEKSPLRLVTQRKQN